MEYIEILKSKLLNEKLSSIEFVMDYVQLRFDGPTFTCYIWPEVIRGDNSFSFGDRDYRNELCGLIGVNVVGLQVVEEESLTLMFEGDRGVIKLNLNPNNPDIFSEIAHFHDNGDNTWMIFD